MNERIKLLRKTLGLSGEKFGNKLGLTRMTISNLEHNRYNLTEQTIKLICREYNVNEDWLRTGNGEMFNTLDTISLDDLASDLEPLELDILKAYFTLDKDIRLKAIEHFKNSLNKD